MADKPLPKGDGGGLIEAINAGNQKIFGIIGRQQRDINTLGRETSTLNDTITADNLVIIDLLVDMSESLGRISESLVPVGMLAQEELEGGPKPVPIIMPQNTAGAAGAEAGMSDEAGDGGKETDKQAKSVGGLTNALAGLGAVAGGGIAALLTGIGIAAAGIGAGMLMGAKAVEVFGDGLSEVAEGIDDLNRVDIDLVKFVELGAALQALTGGLGMGGAVSLMIVASTDMEALAAGIESLNTAEFDPANLEAAGAGLNTFLSQIATGGSLVGGSIGAMVDDNLIPLAEGLERLSAADMPEDFTTKLPAMGAALGAFIGNVGGAGFGSALVTQIIDDNLLPLAEGIERLGPAASNVPNDFMQRMQLAGLGLKVFMDSLDLGLFGAFFGKGAGLQAIDDNLEPLAKGVDAISQVDGQKFYANAPLIGIGMKAMLGGFGDIMGVLGAQMVDDNLPILREGVDLFAEAPAEEFKKRSILMGDGFQALFDGTDDLLGVMGAQMIDDNLPMLRKGVDLFAEAPAEEFAKRAPFVGAGFRDLLAGFGGEGFFDGLKKMLAGFNIQMIDDNLLPLADAVQKFAEVDAASFATNAPDIGAGLNLMVEPLSAFGDAVDEIDPEILTPVAELVRYASELMADGAIQGMAEGVEATVAAAKKLNDAGEIGTFNNFEQLITNLKQFENIDANKMLLGAAALRSLAASAPVEPTGEGQSMAEALSESGNEGAKVNNVITDASIVNNTVNTVNTRNAAGATPAMVPTGSGAGMRVFS